MKIYTGAPAAARHYVEAGWGRADDYYLTEGTGIARRYSADGGVVHVAVGVHADGDNPPGACHARHVASRSHR